MEKGGYIRSARAEGPKGAQRRTFMQRKQLTTTCNYLFRYKRIIQYYCIKTKTEQTLASHTAHIQYTCITNALARRKRSHGRSLKRGSEAGENITLQRASALQSLASSSRRPRPLASQQELSSACPVACRLSLLARRFSAGCANPAYMLDYTAAR